MARRTSGHENVKYVFSCLDAYSKKVWLFALRSKSAEEVAQNLINLLLSFVAGLQSFCDNAKELTGQVMQEVSKAFNCDLMHTLVYSPRANSVERFHADLHQTLTKCLDQHANWPLLLKMVDNAHNSSVSSVNQFCPDEIFFGRRLPTVVETLLSYPHQNEKPHGQYMAETMDRMRLVYDVALQNLRRTAQVNQSIYNRLCQIPEFQIVSDRGRNLVIFTSRQV